MKRIIFSVISSLIMTFAVSAHEINNYRYVVIEHQEDMPKDIEKRLTKEFPKLGFELLTEESYNTLDSHDKDLTLKAVYRCRQSVQCLFRLRLINPRGEEVYEDEQVGAAGFMSYKNDRQSAIKKIFKALKKLNYKFEHTNQSPLKTGDNL